MAKIVTDDYVGDPYANTKFGRAYRQMREILSGTILTVNVGHPIVTHGDFVAWLFSAVRGGDKALPKLLWNFLFQ